MVRRVDHPFRSASQKKADYANSFGSPITGSPPYYNRRKPILAAAHNGQHAKESCAMGCRRATPIVTNGFSSI